MKSNQYEIEIASNKVQNAFDHPDNVELNLKNSNFIDDWQCFQTWILNKYANKNVLITVQVLK
jgi:hypothetical protein